jgi:hypothetical protein
MNTLNRQIAAAALIAGSLLLPASAQPEAPPGSICVTPQNWCRAVRPGPPGAPCACQAPNGWIQGNLR